MVIIYSVLGLEVLMVIVVTAVFCKKIIKLLQKKRE